MSNIDTELPRMRAKEVMEKQEDRLSDGVGKSGYLQDHKTVVRNHVIKDGGPYLKGVGDFEKSESKINMKLLMRNKKIPKPCGV